MSQNYEKIMKDEKESSKKMIQREERWQLTFISHMGVGSFAADCHIVGIAIIMSCLVVGMGIPAVKA